MLTERQIDILNFESEWQGRMGNREAEIRSRFGLTAAGYFQQMYLVIDAEDALEQDAVLVHRLQRLRRLRREQRQRPRQESNLRTSP